MKTKAAGLGALASILVSILVGYIIFKITEGDRVKDKTGKVHESSYYMMTATPPTREEMFEKLGAKDKS
jgi:hypothetical protein